MIPQSPLISCSEHLGLGAKLFVQGSVSSHSFSLGMGVLLFSQRGAMAWEGLGRGEEALEVSEPAVCSS